MVFLSRAGAYVRPALALRRSGRARLALPASLIITALATACGGGEAAPGNGPANPGGAGGGPPALPVGVTVLQPSQMDDSSEYIATLKAVRSTSVRPQVEGHVTRIFVASGDRVTPGTPILQIDPERQRASVASQEASVEAREADVVYARQQFDRLKELHAQRVVSKAELDQAETALKTAEAALSATRAQVREGRVQLQYFQVLAPTSGVIGDVPVRVGDRVTSDTQLTTIDSNDRLEVLVPVPGERAGDLKEGLRLEVVTRDGEALATTAVTFVSPRVDAGTQSVLVKGIVGNPEGRLRSQQFVRARIVWATREGLTVPVLAVTRVSGQNFVFVAEQQGGGTVARQRPVKLGPIVGDAYTVLGGLQAGERVVVSGVQKIGDGAPIAPQGT
jgi:RND family efflux transporter MFP subunit